MAEGNAGAAGSPVGGAPVNTGANGGAVATGQGANPTVAASAVSNAAPVAPNAGGASVAMGTKEVEPAAPVHNIGADGEPEPVGNQAQRDAANAYAATFPKNKPVEVVHQAPAESQPNPNTQPVATGGPTAAK